MAEEMRLWFDESATMAAIGMGCLSRQGVVLGTIHSGDKR